MNHVQTTWGIFTQIAPGLENTLLSKSVQYFHCILKNLITMLILYIKQNQISFRSA